MKVIVRVYNPSDTIITHEDAVSAERVDDLLIVTETDGATYDYKWDNVWLVIRQPEQKEDAE